MENGIIGYVQGRTYSPVADTYQVNTNLRGRYIVRIYGITVYRFNTTPNFNNDNDIPRYLKVTSNEWWFSQQGNVTESTSWYFGYDQQKFYSPLVGEMVFSGQPITFSVSSIYNAVSTLPTTILFYFDAMNVNNMSIDKPLKLPTLCRFLVLNNATYGTTARREITLPCRLNGRYRARFLGYTACDNSANGVFRTNADVLQVFSKELNDFGCVNRNYANGGLLCGSRMGIDTIQINPYPEFITNQISGSVSFMLNSIIGLSALALLYLELWIEFYKLDDELEPLGTNAF